MLASIFKYLFGSTTTDTATPPAPLNEEVAFIREQITSLSDSATTMAQLINKPIKLEPIEFKMPEFKMPEMDMPKKLFEIKLEPIVPVIDYKPQDGSLRTSIYPLHRDWLRSDNNIFAQEFIFRDGEFYLQKRSKHEATRAKTDIPLTTNTAKFNALSDNDKVNVNIIFLKLALAHRTEENYGRIIDIADSLIHLRNAAEVLRLSEQDFLQTFHAYYQAVITNREIYPELMLLAAAPSFDHKIKLTNELLIRITAENIDAYCAWLRSIDMPFAHFTLGLMLSGALSSREDYIVEEYEAALEAFKLIPSTDPLHAHALEQIAHINLLIGNRGEASTALAAAATLSHPRAATVLESMHAMPGSPDNNVANDHS